MHPDATSRVEISLQRHFDARIPNQHQLTLETLSKDCVFRQITIKVALRQPCTRIGPRGLGRCVQTAPDRIVGGDDRPILTGALAHARPDRLGQGQSCDGRAFGKCVTQGRQDEPGLPGRAVKGDTPDRVNDLRVGKPSINKINVIQRRHTGNGVYLQGNFRLGDFAEIVANQRMGHAVGDEFNRQNLARIRNQLVTTIQNAQLYRFKAVDIVRKRRPCLVPIGAAGAKTVLDHPLASFHG